MRILGLTILFSVHTLYADTGSVSGSVPLPKAPGTAASSQRYIGKISRALGTAPPIVAGVWLEGRSLSAPASPPIVTINQRSYQFSRYLTVVPRGTVVRFPNDDPDYHNIYSLSRPKRFDLGRYMKSETPAPEVLFDKAGFVALRCEIHDHMRANIIVVDTPFFTVTDPRGGFAIKGIPPGSYTLHAQVDRKRSWKIAVGVRAGKTSNVQLPAQ